MAGKGGNQQKIDRILEVKTLKKKQEDHHEGDHHKKNHGSKWTLTVIATWLDNDKNPVEGEELSVILDGAQREDAGSTNENGQVTVEFKDLDEGSHILRVWGSDSNGRAVSREKTQKLEEEHHEEEDEEEEDHVWLDVSDLKQTDGYLITVKLIDKEGNPPEDEFDLELIEPGKDPQHAKTEHHVATFIVKKPTERTVVTIMGAGQVEWVELEA